MTQTKNKSIYTMAKVSLMAALLCILGPLSIPLPGLVPISLTNLSIYFICYVLNTKQACVSYLVYLFIGAVGLPVFSAYSGGLAKIMGPTGGYLIGFIFTTLIGSIFVQKFPSNRYLHILGFALGTLVAYVLGTLWLANVAGLTFAKALYAGVVPFLLGDTAKIIVSAIVGPILQKKLKSARVLD